MAGDLEVGNQQTRATRGGRKIDPDGLVRERLELVVLAAEAEDRAPMSARVVNALEQLARHRMLRHHHKRVAAIRVPQVRTCDKRGGEVSGSAELGQQVEVRREMPRRIVRVTGQQQATGVAASGSKRCTQLPEVAVPGRPASEARPPLDLTEIHLSAIPA